MIYNEQRIKDIKRHSYIIYCVDLLIESCFEKRFRTGEWFKFTDLSDYSEKEYNLCFTADCSLLEIYTHLFDRLEHEYPDIEHKIDISEGVLIKVQSEKDPSEMLKYGAHPFEIKTRRKGNSTRRCNEYIQELFDHPNVPITVYDVAYDYGDQFGNRRVDVFLVDRIMYRIHNEWGSVINKEDIQKRGTTLTFIVSNMPKNISKYDESMLI